MDFKHFLKPQRIAEALKTTKSGDFKLATSKIDDDNIQETLRICAQASNMTLAQIQDQFKIDVDNHIQYLSKSKVNKNAIADAPATIAFSYLQKVDLDKLDVYDVFGMDREDLVDRDYFFDLTQYVIGENKSFFPLKSPFSTKAHRPFFYLSPDHLPSIVDTRLKNSARSCQTAFCTPQAEMVFSRKFAESIALTALINKPKTTLSKYKQNGGPIPDHYQYMEFLMIHELLHFSAGDHFYTAEKVKQIMKKNPKIGMRKALKILNYVGDYINNWTIVTSGYAAIPGGLYSDELNFDKMKSYDDIIDAVIKEFEDMEDADFEKMTDAMEENTDEHMDNEDDTPSKSGDESQPKAEPKAQKKPEEKKQDADDKQDAQDAQDAQDSQQGEEGEEGEEQDAGDDTSGDSQDSGDQNQDGDETDDSQDGEGSGDGEEGDDDEDGEQSGDGSGSSNQAKIYKVGDKVVINKSGKVAVVTYAPETWEGDGPQPIEVELLPDVNESRLFVFLQEAISLTAADVSEYKDSQEDDGNGDGDQDDSQDGEEDGDSQDGEGSGDGSGKGQDSQDSQDSEDDYDSDDFGDEEDEEDEEGDESDDTGDGTPNDGSGDMNNDGDGDQGDQGDDEDRSHEVKDRTSDIENAMKNAQDNLRDNRDDGANDAEDVLKDAEAADADAEAANNASQNKAKDSSVSVQYSEESKTISWRKILKKMIPKGVGEKEDTYAKMSRDSTSSMVTAQQTGMGRIKPGEVIKQSNKKGLVFLIDNSYSVINEVHKFNSELVNLIKKNKKMLDNMYIVVFSSGYKVYKVDAQKAEYRLIMQPDMLFDANKKNLLPDSQIAKTFSPHDDQGSVKQLFSKGYGGGTYYTTELHELMEAFHTSGMNIILFTDADLSSGGSNVSNLKRFIKLAKKRKYSLAAFFNNRSSYNTMTKVFGEFNWMSVLK